MSRPEVRPYNRPKHIKDYPAGPCYEAGHLVSINAGWRTEKPIVEDQKCTGCFYCYLCCPEGVIIRKDKKIGIEYDFCKGCGICANVCGRNAIVMTKEGEAHGQ